MSEQDPAAHRAANDNPAPQRSPGWVPSHPDAAPAPGAGAERTALAMLRCGRSFAEACESSGVGLPRLLALWLTRPTH